MLKTITKICLVFYMIVYPFAADAQGILKGKVTDKKNHEPIIGASILVSGTNLSTISDVDGNYQINALPTGTYNLSIRFISY